MMWKYNNQIQINLIEIFVIGVLFILIPPIISLPFLIVWLFQKRNINYNSYIIFFVCMSLYFGAINATKMPGGDQWQYWAAYMNVPHVGFIQSLIYIYGFDLGKEINGISGEFMNGVYNYIGYYITFGHYQLFAALLTFVEYMLIFLGFYKFCLSLKNPRVPIICGVLILSFFYLFFQYTLQIQKQFLAQAIIMYVLGNYAYKCKMNKKLWIMTICAVFTHASMLLFVPFIILKPLHTRLTKVGWIILGTAFVTLIILGPSLAGNIVDSEDTNALTYGISRFSQSETNNDTETNALVLSQIIIIYIPLMLIVLRKLWLERNTLTDNNAFILNVMLLLLLTVIGMYRQPLAQYRYFMMIFAFMPFVYPFISNNIKVRNFILVSISIVMICWFYLKFDKIVWNYAPELDIIIKSPVVLLFGNYYTI